MTTRAAYTKLACSAARTALTIAALRLWFRTETGNRERHAILPGTKEYDEIVEACAVRKTELETMLARQALHKRGLTPLKSHATLSARFLAFRPPTGSFDSSCSVPTTKPVLRASHE